MSVAFQPAKSIYEVIERLDEIVRKSINENSRLGYFPALYNRVTRRIKVGVEKGEFMDNQRMERLDVIFANRYLEAFDGYQKNVEISKSWQLAFEQAKKGNLIVLQHLFLGMSAHISLDLGIAAATIAPGDQIHDLESDFKKINSILFELVNTVQDELGQISFLFKWIDSWLGDLDEELAGFSMTIARDAAWKRALHLAQTPTNEWESVIREMDQKVYGFGTRLIDPPLLVKIPLWVVRLTEKKNIAGNVRILNQDKV